MFFFFKKKKMMKKKQTGIAKMILVICCVWLGFFFEVWSWLQCSLVGISRLVPCGVDYNTGVQ